MKMFCNFIYEKIYSHHRIEFESCIFFRMDEKVWEEFPSLRNLFPHVIDPS